MINYVLGFMFSEDLGHVVLIEKKRPEWQAGKLNGIGGKVEDKELPIKAMEREFKEETDVCVVSDNWKRFCIMIKPDEWTVFCYCHVGKVYHCKTMTDERVFVQIVPVISTLIAEGKALSKLDWLIRLAIDMLQSDVKPKDAYVLY